MQTKRKTWRFRLEDHAIVCWSYVMSIVLKGDSKWYTKSNVCCFRHQHCVAIHQNIVWIQILALMKNKIIRNIMCVKKLIASIYLCNTTVPWQNATQEQIWYIKVCIYNQLLEKSQYKRIESSNNSGSKNTI